MNNTKWNLWKKLKWNQLNFKFHDFLLFDIAAYTYLNIPAEERTTKPGRCCNGMASEGVPCQWEVGASEMVRWERMKRKKITLTLYNTSKIKCLFLRRKYTHKRSAQIFFVCLYMLYIDFFFSSCLSLTKPLYFSFLFSFHMRKTSFDTPAAKMLKLHCIPMSCALFLQRKYVIFNA